MKNQDNSLVKSKGRGVSKSRGLLMETNYTLSSKKKGKNEGFSVEFKI